jgi:hypothetical protein
MESFSKPSPAGCHNGIHDWLNIGSKAAWFSFKQVYWQCYNCDEIGASASPPDKMGCPSGDHNWQKVVNPYVKRSGTGIRG